LDVGIFAEEPLLSALRTQDRAALLAAGSPRRYERGRQLMQQGVHEDFVLAITAGWVVVRADAANGRSLILGFCGPEDLVGELAALDGRPRSATVSTLTPVEACLLSGARFHGFLKDHPAASVAVLRGMALRLRAISSHRQDLGTLPVLQRLARLLLSLDEEAKDAVTGRLSQQELATAIGATRESVAKALAALRDRGVLSTSERSVRVLDTTALTAIAEL
jgi:CRP-like cAMP-binding protein